MVALALLGACGEEGPPATGPAAPEDDPGASLEYSCWGEGTPYRLDPPYDRDEVPEAAWDALDRIQDTHVAMGSQNLDDWDVVILEDDRIEFLNEQDSGGDLPYVQISFTRTDQGRWKWDGGGECRIKAIPPGDLHVVEWWLSEQPVAGDKVLHVEASELDCTGGTKRKPEEFVPQVAYSEDRIEIAVFVESLDLEAATCPSNPSTKLEIELDEPIGERTIVDASEYPPGPVQNEGPYGQ